MAITAVMLGTIVILSWYATRVLIFGGMAGSGRRSSSRSGGGGGGAQAIILIVGLVLMILAPIMAQLIYYAISRTREYLAQSSPPHSGEGTHLACHGWRRFLYGL